MKETLVCGLDEVGRGALAGPLMAGAALFRFNDTLNLQTPPMPGLMDSKAFSTLSKREHVWKMLLHNPFLLDFGIGEASVEEINIHGIDWANNAAFQRAVAALNQAPHFLLVDGKNPVKGWPLQAQFVEPKADAKYWPVSAASIIAKVIRDRLMMELDREFPSYGWETNMGYGSERHKNALARVGATPHHRTQFIQKMLGRPKMSKVVVAKF